MQTNKIDWLICGGESGPGARPCEVDWIRSAVQQCKAAGVACFVKQLGARVMMKNDTFSEWPDQCEVVLFRDFTTCGDYQGAPIEVALRSRKGGDPSEWPEDLRVREFPLPPGEEKR